MDGPFSILYTIRGPTLIFSVSHFGLLLSGSALQLYQLPPSLASSGALQEMIS